MRKARHQNRPLPARRLLRDKRLEPLFSEASLESLIEIVLSQDRIRNGLRNGPFGPRVTDLNGGSQSMGRIMAATARVLGTVLNEAGPVPRLVIDDRLSRLKSETIRSFAALSGLALCLTTVSALAWPVGSAFVPIAGSGLALLSIPLLVHRRTRIHLEHQCTYSFEKQGQGTIRMAQLPRIQFDSYLTHEFGHHLSRMNADLGDAAWRREGWARLFQWAVVSAMAEEARQPVYLYHALSQTIGELKFACEMICRELRRPVPKRLRSVKSMFSTNPLLCLVTGTPLTDIDDLARHGIGSAFYFLAAQHEGLDAALQRPFPLDGLKNQAPPSPAKP